MTTKYDDLVQAVHAFKDGLGESRMRLIDDVVKTASALVAESPTASDVHDGYHTGNDLYRHRMLLNAALFNTWYKHLPLLGAHKSRRHHDEENDPMYPGFFIVVAEFPRLGQISYHYKLEHWDLFQIEELDVPQPYDGHTPEQVEQRITAWLSR